jgi:hypothetical protein
LSRFVRVSDLPSISTEVDPGVAVGATGRT